MCVSPGTVFLYKRPGESKWMSKYYASMPKDEAIREGVDIDVLTSRAHDLDAKWYTVPCGQCFQCRLQRSRVWANRCLLEMDSFKPVDGVCRNWFLTLTYNPSSVNDLVVSDSGSLSLHDPNRERNLCLRSNRNIERIRSAYADPGLLDDPHVTPEALRVYQESLQSLDDYVYESSEIPEAKRDHLSKFLHDLRQFYSRKFHHTGIRFFACGEYGDQYLRPHYHLLLFNCPIPEDTMTFLFKNKFGHKYYSVSFLEELWGKGFAPISEANWNNAAYTARYIMKKQTGAAAECYDTLGIKAPFVRMSLKPGIGFSAYKGFDTYFRIDPVSGELKFKSKLVLPNAPDNIESSVSIPKYFDKVFKEENPEAYEIMKEHRENMAEIAYKTRKQQITMSDRELFEAQIEAYNRNPKGLRRNFIDFT